MAIPFKSPTPKHAFDPSSEIKALNKHFKKRGVPKSRPGHLLLVSANIANLGAQKRSDSALRVLAHMCKRFDLIALQELNADYHKFARIIELMGSKFDFVMNDTAGNDERLAFIYRHDKVGPTQLCGEIALRPREYPKRNVKVRYRQGGQDKVQTFKNHRFVPFDRNPFVASFTAGNIDFTLANVHLYFGKFQNSTKEANRLKYARRVLEIYALSRWADRRLKNPRETYDKDIVLLGDMNIPVMDKKDAAFKALTTFGFQAVNFLADGKTGGSNIRNDKTYDQVAFAPGSIGKRVTAAGVFDFDNAVFKSLWDKIKPPKMAPKKAASLFDRHVKHHFTDHRPIWVELRTS